MDTTQTPEYIVKDGNFFRRTYQEINLGPLSDVIQKAKQVGYSIIPDVFTIEHPTKVDYENNTSDEPQLKIPCHIGRNGNTLHIAHRLIYYPIYGYFNIPKNEKGEIGEEEKNITYAKPGRGHKIRVGCDYPGLWMIYAFRLQNHRIVGFHNCYMSTNIRGKHFAPYLPNIFDNGKICLGEVEARYSGDMQACVQGLFNEFFMAESNDHLMRDKGWQILQFTHEIKEKKQITKWDPPQDFLGNPKLFHNHRDTTVAAEFLEMLADIEQTDNSQRILS